MAFLDGDKVARERGGGEEAVGKEGAEGGGLQSCGRGRKCVAGRTGVNVARIGVIWGASVDSACGHQDKGQARPRWRQTCSSAQRKEKEVHRGSRHSAAAAPPGVPSGGRWTCCLVVRAHGPPALAPRSWHGGQQAPQHPSAWAFWEGGPCGRAGGLGGSAHCGA